MARVLLVDDDAGVLDTRGAILRHAGLEVETAACGRRALVALDRDPCDLLLLDLKLPDMTGLDVLAEARRRGSTVPVVILTGHPSFDTAVEAMRLGAVDYLLKPVFEDPLMASVERALGGPNGRCMYA
jgi:DNA-binding NtrC family response regulator